MILTPGLGKKGMRKKQKKKKIRIRESRRFPKENIKKQFKQRENPKLHHPNFSKESGCHNMLLLESDSDVSDDVQYMTNIIFSAFAKTLR